MNKQVMVKTFEPVQDVPTQAPKPPTDLDNPNLSVDDILTENYFSMAALEAWLEDRNAEARVLTVTGCTVEYLYDPQTDKDGVNGEWKPVLWFDDTDTGLVINKSRAAMLRKVTGSPLLAAWAQAGTIAIRPGIANGKAQIVLATVEAAASNGSNLPEEYGIEEANEDFFN